MDNKKPKTFRTKEFGRNKAISYLNEGEYKDMTPEAIEYLRKFNREWVGDVSQKSFSRTKKSKKVCRDRQNQARRDVLNTLKVVPLDTEIAISTGNTRVLKKKTD